MSGLVMRMNLTPANADKKYSEFWDRVEEKGPTVHLKWVFRVLEYVVKYSRVRTGRSRAAWFPLMDLHGFNYQRSLGTTRTDGREVSEGYAQGSFEDEPFHTTVMNNVQYVGYVNSRWGLFSPDKVTAAKGQKKALKGIRLQRGLMFEEKIPQFEAYGADTWNEFLEITKKAFEKGGGPGEVGDVEVPPPSGTM